MRKSNSYNTIGGEGGNATSAKTPDKNEHKWDPRCDIYRRSNMAITMSYFSVGVVTSLIQTPLNIYMVEVLNAEPSLQNTIAILQTLPWSLKLIFGFLSDSCPIYGMQRKPYLLIGALVYSGAFITYGLTSIDNTAFLALCVFIGTLGLIMVDVVADTMCVQRSRFEKEEHRGQMQSSFYSVRFAGGLIGAIIGAVVCNKGVGLSFHGVSLCIGLVPFLLIVPWIYVLRERFQVSAKVFAILSRRNSEAVPRLSRRNSEVPSKNPTERSPLIGSASPQVSRNPAVSRSPQVTRSPLVSKGNRNLEMSPMRTVPTSASGTSNGTGPSLPNMDSLETGTEDDPAEDTGPWNTHPVFIQINDIWETVQLKAVWRPMLFVYTYNLLQVPNVAWQSYLQLTLKFPPYILGLTVILGSFMTFAGIMAYKTWFFKSSWRMIYVGTMCLTTFFSLLQIVLIFQWNIKYLHMSNYFFSLGDDVITAYIAGIQFLPVCIMYMRLCPDGAEGASYSMLTTFGNIALVCASNIGNLLTGLWDVSNDALREGNVDGLWKLSLLTSLLAMLPILWLRLLPDSAEEQEELAKSQDRSVYAGITFLVVLFGSLFWTSFSAVYRVVYNV